MFRKFLSSLLLKVESKMSNSFRENVFRNVFLYPLFIFILQIPILLTQHVVYSVIVVSLAVISLIGYFICLKVKVVCQLEYSMMLFLMVTLTVLSYIGFFIHIEIYNFMFIFLQSVGVITAMNVMMMYGGRSKDALKHYPMTKFTSNYDKDELAILANLILSEIILVRYIFSNFKEMYKAYIPHLDLYIGIDFSNPQPSGIGHYVVADNFDLVNSYSLLDFIKHIKDNDLNVNETTRKDFEVFMMNIY